MIPNLLHLRRLVGLKQDGEGERYTIAEKNASLALSRCIPFGA